MRFLSLLLLSVLTTPLWSQNASLKGKLQGPEKEAIPFANLALFSAKDSSLNKVAATDEQGLFVFAGLKAGSYFLKASYLGMKDLFRNAITVNVGEEINLGELAFEARSLAVEEVTITAARPLLEVKSDRTIFNVSGTINSTGSDALSLLRKAPNVTLDNNDNISVLGRSGVLIYVDGKRLPLSSADLSAYLQSLTAEQIDRIDIISNPGAKYEAEGNAGIIDIRLKRDKNLGANGTLNSTVSQGFYGRGNLSGTANYRNKKVNIFGSAAADAGIRFDSMRFKSFQYSIIQRELNTNTSEYRNVNYRVGLDFFQSKAHTLGMLVSGARNFADRVNLNRIGLSQQVTPDNIDSILVARNTIDNPRTQQTYNLNYRFDNQKGRVFNFDADYGNYHNETRRNQPNQYYDPTETTALSRLVRYYDTPTDIDIFTIQADYEDKLWGGILSIGSKWGRVNSDNSFLVYDEIQGQNVQNDSSSNRFNYDEEVLAGYFSYTRPLGKTFNLSAGLRAELTDADGDLQTFLPELQEPPVRLNYLSWFPNLGLSWQMTPQNSLSFNAGRRINRPDYNVLNPFNNQLSEISYEKGNPRLNPEIVNNAELGYTLAYRYNFKLAYSKTLDQITRLIAPDLEDKRANFITWANLATQEIWSFNISAPIQIAPKWNAYFNAGASHINNQANYGKDGIVDVQAFTYSIYQQHTFDLPLKIKGEISGYYSGPGVWGGVFIYESSWSLDIGLQRKFLKDRLNVRISGSDLFFQSGWDGVSDFNGLKSYGSGRWDSRRVSLSLGYRFGNDNVKSRKRQTSIESEQSRIQG